MNPLAVITHPRRAFSEIALRPKLLLGFLVVLASGFVSFCLGALANALAGGGLSGFVVAAMLPALFVAYWLLEGWLIEAGARLNGAGGRRRDFLSVSGWAFPAWVTYAVLSLLESLALRSAGGSGATVASALAWCTLPVLAWFVALTALAIRAVYGVPLLNALALAMLPYAALLAALLVVGLALGLLRGAGLAG